MAALIEVAYERQFTDAVVQAILGRGVATINVLQQLGAAYHNLPGMSLADLQARQTGLSTDVNALAALIDQMRPLLISIDAKAGPLDEIEKALLRVLQGLLMTDADRALLYQITGPTEQSGGSTPTPPAPTS